MNSKFLRICSMILTIVMVVNMLPMQALGEMVFTEKQTVSATDETLSAESTTISPNDITEATVIGEIEANRTEYSKEFKMSNGLHMAVVYGEPVHYESDGEWAEIDNTLKATTAGTFTNTAGVWEVTLPQQMTANSPVTITKDGYTLSFVLAGELNKPSDAVVMSEQTELSVQGNLSAGNKEDGVQTFALASTQAAAAQQQDMGVAQAKAGAEHPETISDKLTSRLLYADIYPNTNVTYDLDSNKVKESIIIERYDADLRGYKYTLNVGELVPVLYDDGRIDFFNADKSDIVMTMPAPFLMDAAYKYNEDIQVQLVGKGSTYTLIYILPQNWLAEESRQWPVILDPVVAANTSTSNIRDQQITENTEYSHTRGVMEAGYGANDGIERFFIKYKNLPALSAADVVVYARIDLYKPETSSTSAVIEVHGVKSTWESETLHWSNKPDFKEEIEDYRVVQNAGTYSWDVTDIARGWYEGENTGMMFKASKEVEEAEVANWKQFYTSDYGVSSYKPTLFIEFRNSSGLEDYWSFTSASAGRAGTGYVNDHTGNLVWVHNDIGFGGNRKPVTIEHIYNASDIGETDRYGTSPGWRTNLNQRIYPWTDPNYYVWEDGDGTKHYFLKESNGVYKDEDGLELTFTNTGSGSSYFKITSKDGSVMHFDNMRRLRKIENNQETKSSITIEYPYSTTYKISKVTDGAGRVYNYIYNSSGLLERISYTGTGTSEIDYVTFGYSNGILTSITYKDGESVTYSYRNNLLIRATDIDDYNVRYAYSTYNENGEGKPSRVIKVEEFDKDSETGADIAGGSMDIEYAHNQTKFTDHNGNVQISQFNDFGNTVSVQDGLGRAQMAQYANTARTDAGKGNQLQLSSKLQNTVNNLFTNHSFEQQVNISNSQISVSTDEHYLGARSLKLTGATASTGTYSVSPGESYTFSAWLKTSEKTAWLTLDDTEKSAVVEPSTEWKRVEVRYTNNGETTASITPKLVTEGTGAAYMDCIQLEKMAAASRYNLLENSDFTDSLAGTWTGTDFTITTATASSEGERASAAPHLDDKVLSVTGDPTSQKHLSQTLNISGAKGDSFVLAAWAKGDSVPLIKDGDNQRTFGVEVTFNYTTAVEEPKEKKITFNPDTDSTVSWQYATAPIVAEEAYNSVTVTVTYDYNANTVLFDGIQLFKEAYGDSYTYDDEGNVVAVKDLQEQTTTYEYTNNDLTTAVLPSGAKLTYEYDSHHNVIEATSEEGLIFEFEYDTYGNNTKVSIVTKDDNGNTVATISSSAEYSSDGNRKQKTTDILGNTTQYCYNADTNVLEWTQNPKDSAETRTELTYDSMLRMVSTELSTDTKLDLSAEYNYSEDLLQTIQTPSTLYSFEYGNFAVRRSVSIGSRVLASYSYTERNNYLRSIVYGNTNDSIEYTYDNYGRLLTQKYEDGDIVSYQYDNEGVLASVSDSATGITVRYYYDFTGRATGYSESGSDYTHTVSYEYDNINNLTKLVEIIDDVECITSYTYDKDNRATEITTDGVTVAYTFDGFGRISQQVTKIGETVVLTELFTFNGTTDVTTSNQVETYKIYAPDASTEANLRGSYAYTYDKNNNITKIIDGEYETTYTYDSANQLIREDNQRLGKSYFWTYDNAGNIVSRKEYSYTTGSLSGNPDSFDYVYNDLEGWGDLLTYWEGKDIVYDDIGNPTLIGDKDNTQNEENRTFSWEHGRQLATVTEDGVTWRYTYNNAGLRTARTNDTTTYKYVYNGSQLSKMTVANTSAQTQQVVFFSYDASGTPLSMTYNGQKYLYLTNLQGDVTGILDTTGVKLVSYDYTAYGQCFSISNDTELAVTLSGLNPLRYRGYVLDVETDLYYLQSRYYDPYIGRFLNSDVFPATGQGVLGNNMFSYCGNNPVNRSDSAGHFWDIVFDVVSLVSSVVEVVSNPKDVGAWVGLACDIIDVAVPMVGGLGETARAVDKAIEVADTVTDTLDNANDVRKATQTTLDSISNASKNLPSGGNTVYVSYRSNGSVEYVGITNDFGRRQKEWGGTRNIEVLTDNLDRDSARIVEQTVIDTYGIGKNGGILSNKINSISKKNSRLYSKYLEFLNKIR